MLYMFFFKILWLILESFRRWKNEPETWNWVQILLQLQPLQVQMAQYLCSTNADETLHGERLPVATHIRRIFPDVFLCMMCVIVMTRSYRLMTLHHIIFASHVCSNHRVAFTQYNIMRWYGTLEIECSEKNCLSHPKKVAYILFMLLKWPGIISNIEFQIDCRDPWKDESKLFLYILLGVQS